MESNWRAGRSLSEIKDRSELWTQLMAAHNTPKDLWPQDQPYKKLTSEEESLLSTLTTLVTEKATLLGINPRLLASKQDLEHMTRSFCHTKNSAIMNQSRQFSLLHGWRYQEIGQEILDSLDQKSPESYSGEA